MAGYSPLDIFNARTGRELPSKGNFIAHISYNITPRDHISVLNE